MHLLAVSLCQCITALTVEVYTKKLRTILRNKLRASKPPIHTTAAYAEHSKKDPMTTKSTNDLYSGA